MAVVKRAGPDGKEGNQNMPVLTTRETNLNLTTIPEWSKSGKTILRTFVFDGFLQSVEFVNGVAKRAQKANHHPDIDIRFNKVTLKLSTHDEGGITEKDFSLARQCDEVLAKVRAV